MPSVLPAPRMRCLRLSHNLIGDVGLKSLARVAAGGALDSLTELKLNANQITDEGLRAFSTHLVPSSTRCPLPLLNELHLGGNMVGPDGMWALGGAVHDGALPRLREVWLHRQEVRLTNDEVISLSHAFSDFKLIRAAG